MRGTITTIENAVAGIDELRVVRDRARVRLEVALDLEREAAEHFRNNLAAYDAWKSAAQSATEAEESLKAAQAEYSKALAAAERA